MRSSCLSARIRYFSQFSKVLVAMGGNAAPLYPPSIFPTHLFQMLRKMGLNGIHGERCTDGYRRRECLCKTKSLITAYQCKNIQKKQGSPCQITYRYTQKRGKFPPQTPPQSLTYGASSFIHITAPPPEPRAEDAAPAIDLKVNQSISFCNNLFER